MYTRRNRQDTSHRARTSSKYPCAPRKTAHAIPKCRGRTFSQLGRLASATPAAHHLHQKHASPITWRLLTSMIPRPRRQPPSTVIHGIANHWPSAHAFAHVEHAGGAYNRGSIHVYVEHAGGAYNKDRDRGSIMKFDPGSQLRSLRTIFWSSNSLLDMAGCEGAAPT